MRGWIALVLIGAACAAALALAQQWTARPIAANWQALRAQVFSDMLGAPVAQAPDGAMFGSCSDWLGVRVSVPGYAGAIEFLAVVWPGDATLSMRAGRHQETPGIGDFIDGVWLARHDRSTRAVWAGIDGVSGATITTKAVRDAAEQAAALGGSHCGG